MAAPSEKKAKVDLADEESYLLRAAFKADDKVTRELVVGAHHTLGQLEDALLKSFGYKDNTLNAFFLDGKALSKAPNVAYYSLAGPPPHMSVKTFKQINPAVGANWVYVYDLQADQYGEVVISVVEARPVAKAVETITITKSEGTAPPAPSVPEDQDEDEDSGEEEEEDDDGDNYEESGDDAEEESSEEKPKKGKSGTLQRAGSKRGRKGGDDDDDSDD